MRKQHNAFEEERNHFHLQVLWEEERIFKSPIIELRKRFGLPPEMELQSDNLALLLRDGLNASQKLEDEAYAKRCKFLISLTERRKKEFYFGVIRILKDNNLGNEWIQAVVDLIVSGFLHAPPYNFDMRADDKNKTLEIRLNARTSLRDIADWWDMIEKEQKRIFGEVKRSKFTASSLKQVHQYLMAKRINNKQRKEYVDPATGEILRKTNSDIAAELYRSGDVDVDEHISKKDTNRFKQLKHRVRDKFSIRKHS